MTREDLEQMSQKLAPRLDATLHSQLGERTGFLLFLFDFNPEGPMAADGDKTHVVYITNAKEADAAKMVREVLGYLEAGITSEPRGPRGTT